MNASSALETRPTSPGIWKPILIGIPLVVMTLFFVVWRMQLNHLASRPVDTYGKVPQFRLTNQQGAPFGSSELDGKIWIADFIFTSCPSTCPIISSRMAELQKPLGNTGVQLVSFTVDPQKDTPEILRGYAERLNADQQRWAFLTGAKPQLYSLSADGFKLAATDGNDESGGQPIHSTRFVLVDRHRNIRGYYDALAPDAVTKLIADTRHLLREQPQ
jgi:protein SCO1/2